MDEANEALRQKRLVVWLAEPEREVLERLAKRYRFPRAEVVRRLLREADGRDMSGWGTEA